MDLRAGDVRRPRVVVSAAASADGRITLGSDQLLMDEEPGSVWRSLQPPSAQGLDEARSALLERLYQPQATLEGSGSLVRHDAGPVAGLPAADPAAELYTDFLPDHVVHRPGRTSWFTLVDSRGRVRWTMKSNGEADLLVLAARATPADYLGFLRSERIPYLVVGDERVDLGTALRRMAGRLGVTCVVSTAGGGLNGALLRAGLVDEFHVLVYPTLIGGKGTPTLFDGPQLAARDPPTPLRLLSAQVESDGVLWLRYEVSRQGGPAG